MSRVPLELGICLTAHGPGGSGTLLSSSSWVLQLRESPDELNLNWGPEAQSGGPVGPR